MSSDANNVIERVRRALGRSEPLKAAPIPPAMDEPITRLVHSDIGLAELFAKTARENKILVEMVRPEELTGRVVEFLKSKDVKRIAIPASRLLEKLNLPEALLAAGFEVKRWEEMGRDELYDFDCGLTDVHGAVAETGSLVMRPSAGHGRSLSLVPPIHVAIVEPKNIVPDLVDLFEKLTSEGLGSAISIVSGPSKTSDIEMNLVVGVHGPTIVQVFLIQ